MEAGLRLVEHHQHRRPRGEQGRDEQQVTQRAVGQLGRGERSQHAGLAEREVEPARRDGHLDRRPVERVRHRVVERGAVTDLPNRLQRRRQVGAVVVEYRRPRPDLGASRRSLSVDPEPVVEPPAPDLVANRQQLGRSPGVGQLGEHALPGRDPTAQLHPLAAVAGPDQWPGALDEHGVRPGHGAAEDDLPLHLWVKTETGLDGYRQAQVDQIAKPVVAGVAQSQTDRTVPAGALYRIPALSSPAQRLGAGPQRRRQPALPRQRRDHAAGPAVGEQPERPVEAGLAGAVGAGHDVEPVQSDDDVAQGAVPRDGDGRDHAPSVGPDRDSLSRTTRRSVARPR